MASSACSSLVSLTRWSGGSSVFFFATGRSTFTDFLFLIPSLVLFCLKAEWPRQSQEPRELREELREEPEQSPKDLLLLLDEGCWT